MSAWNEMGFGTELKKQLKTIGVSVGLLLLRWLIEYLAGGGGNPPDDAADRE